MKLSITFEITDKQLQEALIPSGGKITSITVGEEVKRRGRPPIKGSSSSQDKPSKRKAGSS